MKPATILLVAELLICPAMLLAQGSDYDARSVIFKLNPGHTIATAGSGRIASGSPSLDAKLQAYGTIRCVPLFPSEGADLELRNALGMDRIYLAMVNAPTDVRAMADELQRDPAVEYAETNARGCATGISAVDSLVPNDTYFNREWGYRNTGTFPTGDSARAGADIKAIHGWPITTGDSTIIVAVLDSGIKWDHPEFSGRVWSNKGEIPGNGIDDDVNLYIDDIRGWNFAYGNNNVSDDQGHGTNVAGIIGAKGNNSSGYAGLDWKCKIMPLKILDSNGYGYYSNWQSAIYYAANKGAKVLNMSVGGTSYSSTLETALRYAYQHGCFIAASMANNNDSTKYYPAAFDTLVVAVGATDCRDRRASPFAWGGGSCYGSWIDVCAPGNKIYGLYHKNDTDFGWYWSGTSQASPMVAGLASLLLAQNNTRTPAQLKTIVRATADDQVGRASEDKAGFDVFHGFGRINCYRALTYTSSDVPVTASALPERFRLYPNYPNPFNPLTTVRYSVPADAEVLVTVIDLLGREVATLSNAHHPPGEFAVSWDASDRASGIYFCRFQATLASGITHTFIMRMVLLK